MKKILTLTAIVIVLGLARCGNNETYTRDLRQLPKNAQEMIHQNFRSAVTLVETEKEGLEGKEFEVTLANGSEITFNGKGEWKNIETPNNLAVPSALIPPTIAEFVKSHHAGASIVGIEIIKKGYEVELSNGVEIQFNKDGGFIQYDK